MTDLPDGSFCMDCHLNTSEMHEYYMVNDDVWLAAVPLQLGMLCVYCLEVRLGRQLTVRDFDRDWMDQFTGPQSDLLVARTTGVPPPWDRVHRIP